MQHSAIHDPRALATPSQLRFEKERRVRLATFERRAVHAPPPVSTEAKPPEAWFRFAVLSILAQYNGREPSRQPRVDEIIRVVAKCHNVTRHDILSPRRTAQVVWARQIAMYLAKTLTRKSLPEIGRCMDRDHSAVLFGIRKITLLRQTDASLSADLDALTHALGGTVA